MNAASGKHFVALATPSLLFIFHDVKHLNRTWGLYPFQQIKYSLNYKKYDMQLIDIVTVGHQTGNEDGGLTIAARTHPQVSCPCRLVDAFRHIQNTVLGCGQVGDESRPQHLQADVTS